MKNYILNIKTGKIHDGKNPCFHCKRTAIENIKDFDELEEAINYYEGTNKKGEKCNVCFKNMD